MITILDILQYLKSDIKVTVYDGIPMQMTHRFDHIEKINEVVEEVMPGFEYDIEVEGQYIKYNDTESFRPTAEEILAVDREVAEAALEARREVSRKELRNEEGKKDLSLVASFGIYKTQNNVDITFEEYMDILEDISNNL